MSTRGKDGKTQSTSLLCRHGTYHEAKVLNLAQSMDGTPENKLPDPVNMNK